MRSIRSKAKLRTVPRDRVLSRTQGPSLEAQGLSRTDTHFSFLNILSSVCAHTHTLPNQNHIPHTTSTSHNLTVTNPHTDTHGPTPHPQPFRITDMNQKTNSYSFSAIRMYIRPYTHTQAPTHSHTSHNPAATQAHTVTTGLITPHSPHPASHSHILHMVTNLCTLTYSQVSTPPWNHYAGLGHTWAPLIPHFATGAEVGLAGKCRWGVG